MRDPRAGRANPPEGKYWQSEYGQRKHHHQRENHYVERRETPGDKELGIAPQKVEEWLADCERSDRR
jgi:hypothetical protein